METPCSREDLETLREAPIGVVTDALIQYSVRGMMAGLYPLAGFAGRRTAGTAVTIRFLPARGVPGRRMSPYDVLHSVGEGSVIVVDGMGGAEFVFAGDNMARLARNRGAAGMVIDGYARDATGLREADLPIYARGLGVRLQTGFYDMVDTGQPIACAGVQVREGDVVLADEDGVLVVPQEAAARIAQAVREMLPLEAELDAAIRADRPLAEIRAIMAKRQARRSWE